MNCRDDKKGRAKDADAPVLPKHLFQDFLGQDQNNVHKLSQNPIVQSNLNKE